MKNLLYGLVIGACLIALHAIAPAMAQETVTDGKVSIPWGDLLASSADVITSLAITVLAAGLAMLPPSILKVIKTWQVEQLLERAVGYGINAVAGAVKGETLSVPVGNKVIEEAAEYAVQNGSAALVKWMGGKNAIKDKLIARVDLEKLASKDKLP